MVFQTKSKVLFVVVFAVAAFVAATASSGIWILLAGFVGFAMLDALVGYRNVRKIFDDMLSGELGLRWYRRVVAALSWLRSGFGRVTPW